ncbi:MAG: rod shape-determining protein MreC [Anaerolineales bacterium]|nr:rod shape-determining protein MreC [Anaerolineales bacterium]
MNKSNTRLLVAGTLTLITIGLMVLSLSGFLTPIQDVILRPISSIQAWIALRVAAIRDVLTSPRDVASLQAEVARLEAEVARLQQEIISLREQAAEAEVLAALLDYARSQPQSRSIAANVIGQDVSPFLRSIWIGRGSDSNLSKGMPVVTERGLIGRIVEVRPTISRVQLITDPEAVVNVKLQLARAEGVLTADFTGDLLVDLIDQSAEVSVGELVLTSGLGGKYPADIPVGQVLNVTRLDFQLFQQANVQPSVDFDALQIVLVITNFRPIPLEPSTP